MVRLSRFGPVLVLLVILGVARAQDATILYKDRVAKKNGIEVVGTIEEETFLGVKIKSAKTKDSKFIPAADLERIVYKTKDVDPITYRDPFLKEEKAKAATESIRALADPTGADEKARLRLETLRTGFLEDAILGFAKLEKEVRNPPSARRYFQFKRTEILILQARIDPARMDAAVKALTEFKTTYRDGWQLLVALETLAKIQEDAGKTDEARKTYEELAGLPGASDTVKQQSGLFVAKLYLRGKQYKEAEASLTKVVKEMSAGDLQKPLAEVYLIESQIGLDKKTDTVIKDLAALIAGTTDARVRSVAYSLIGDFHAKKGQETEAFWNYLRVDAQYNEDTDAHARALYQLSSLFDKVKKDPLRGKDCLARLLDKRFEGSPYQKLAQAASKKE